MILNAQKGYLEVAVGRGLRLHDHLPSSFCNRYRNFIIVIIILCWMLQKTRESGMIIGYFFIINKSDIEVVLIQIVNHIIIFCNADKSQLENLKIVLLRFEITSGLS